MSAVDLLARARSVAALVEEEAPVAEAELTLTRRCVDALVEAGLFRMVLPREVGGHEAAVETQIRVYEEVARADGSAGWCLMAGAASAAFAAAYMGETAVREIFDGRDDVILAGQLAPRGQTVREGAGFRVRGQWSFGSGIAHSAYVLGGTIELDGGKPVLDEAGVPALRVIGVPREKVDVQGNWGVMGLRGTGSFDYAIADAEISGDWSFLLFDEPRRGGPLFRLGVLALTSAGHAGYALGVGRRALDEIAALSRTRQRMGKRKPLASHGTFQKEYARHEARLRSARALVLDAFGAAEREVQGGDPLSLPARALVRIATTHATEEAAAAATFAYLASGSDGLRDGSTLQRVYRDAHASTQHIMVDEGTYLDGARALLGIAPPGLRL